MRSFSAKIKGERAGGPKGSPPSLKFHGPNENRYVTLSVGIHPPQGMSLPPSSPASLRTRCKGRYGGCAEEPARLRFLAQMRQRLRKRKFIIHCRGVFEAEDALVAELFDLAEHEWIVRLAREHLMPPRHARRMEVADNVDRSE